jgi:hypothetical protein
MDDASDVGAELRLRCNTWPLKRLLTEDFQAQPPEPFQIQYFEDSNHSLSYHAPTDSPQIVTGPTAFPPLESCWTSDSFGFPPVQASSYSFQQPDPSTSTFNDAQTCPNEEEEDKVELDSKFCRQRHDSTGQRKMNPWGDGN